jgi:hypothetical protein
LVTLKKLLVMKRILFIGLIGFFSCTAMAQQTFGGAVDASEVHKAAEIPELLKGKTEVKDITVIGQVMDVCQAKGCWMTMDVGGQKMTVKFKDYAFFMPKDCSGKQVTFTGKAFKKVISVAEQKHLAEDAGKSKKEIKKITTPKEEYQFEASGVILQG